MALPPGPSSPAVFQTLRYMRHPEQSLLADAARYGAVYTRKNAIFGNEVLVSDPALLKQIFTGDPAVYLSGAANTAVSILVGLRSIMVLDGDEHRRTRRRMTPPFHAERMSAYSAEMRDLTLEAISGWREGETVALVDTLQKITLDVILRTVFGLEDGPRRDAIRDHLLGTADMLQTPRGMLMVMPAFQRNLGPLTKWAAFIKARARMNELILEQIADRRAASATGPQKDVLSLLLSARDEDGQGMTDEEVRDNLLTLVLAGYETTATSIGWAIAEILAQPEILGRVLSEIDAASPEAPFEGLEYLDAAIKEALRLRPIVPMVVRKLAAPVTLGDHEIPAGTHVLAAIYTTQRRADIYPEPDVFKPERFLGKRPDPYAWMPFGGGVRRCLGMAFALHEMKVVIATVLSRARLRLARPGPQRVSLRSFFFGVEGGAPAIVEGWRSPVAAA
jgi:cytochrome P450 family 110